MVYYRTTGTNISHHGDLSEGHRVDSPETPTVPVPIKVSLRKTLKPLPAPGVPQIADPAL